MPFLAGRILGSLALGAALTLPEPRLHAAPALARRRLGAPVCQQADPAESEKASGGFGLPFLSREAPAEQQPAVAYGELTSKPFFDWPTTDEYGSKLLNLYFATMGALEGLSPSEIYARAKEKFHRAWALSIVVWSPVQFLNFCYVPPPLQPALVAAVNVGWQATLSILNASHAEAAVVVDAQDAELALLRSELDRLALENDALRGEVEAARQRRWWWPWR